MEEAPANYLNLGSLNGPHIDIIAQHGYKGKITLQDAVCQ
jgi:hypothetical protein